MKDKAEGANPLRLSELIEYLKRRLDKIPRSYLEWGAVVSILAAFGWLQIETQQAFGPGEAGLALVVMVLFEVVVLVWVNRRFL